MKKNTKSAVVFAVTLCVALLVATASYAANLKDIAGHWAESYIEYGVDAGYISGYDDGTFLPDKTVTRAEFSKMINSAVKLTSYGEARGEFNDIAVSDWFFNEVKKAENAGYITGYEDGSFRPNNTVTRQEAAVILSRIVLPVEDRTDVAAFADGNAIDSWAEDSVSMIAAKGYIKGDDKGNFNPKGALTRSQAAKLICEFVKNENVVNNNQNVETSDDEVVYSETLFTDDVVIDVEDAVALNVVFKNCRILGDVYVKTAGVTVELENAKIKNLYVEAEDAYVDADDNSEVKNAYVEAPSTLKGDNFKKVVLSGENLSNGLVKLEGEFAKVEAAGDALVSASEIKDLAVSKKISLVINSGTVEKLTVESGAKDATINLSKKAVVKEAHNKAAVSYVGSGTIEKANNEVSGVSFDGVIVNETVGKKGDGDSVGSKTDEDFFKNVEVDPEDKKTKVAISKSVSLTFLSEVFDKSGEELTSKYIKDNFKLTKSSASGTAVEFSVTIASGGKKITVNPDENLKNGTKYYLTIPAGVLTYEDGTENGAFTSYFTTIAAPNEEGEDDSSGNNDSSDENAKVTMSPKNGDDDVSVNTTIKLTFDGTLKAYSGTLDEEYIEEEAIKIYEGSTSGNEVNFTASISSKTITLNPSRLLGETKYYVVILGNKLKVGGNTLSKTTMSFTTEEGTAISISPENGASGVSTLPEITVSFAESMLKINGDKLTEDYIQDNVVAIKEGSTKDSAEDVYYSVTSIAENGRSFVIVPDEELEANTTYYIIIEEGSLLGETSEEENAKVTSSFKTASAMSPMFTPYDGKEGVSVGTEIKISFSDELLVYAKDKTDRVEVDDAYLDELINGYEDSKGKIQGKNRITLKRVGASKPLAITATIDTDGKTIIITPEEALIEEKEYTISIEKNLFYSLNGTSYKANTSGSATFSTNVAMSPAITPKNEAENVAVTVNPTIKFSETELYRTDDVDKKITGTYLKNNAITFVDQYDNEVEFSVELSGSTITVVPEEDLEGNVEYTLTLVAGTIANADGVENSEKSVTFTTKISYTLEVTPSGSKTGVSPFVCPTVKFGTEVFTVKDKDLGISEGDIVDEEYASKYIFLTEGTKSTDSDDAIPATIEIGDDGRTFTIIPEDELDFNTKYYINVVEKKFLYADEETKNKANSTYFTTIKEPAITKIKADKNNSTSIKITYTSNVADSSEDKLAKLVVEGGPETKEFNITSTSSSSVTIKGLEKDTEYTFTVYIVYDGQIESEAKEVTAST